MIRCMIKKEKKKKEKAVLASLHSLKPDFQSVCGCDKDRKLFQSLYLALKKLVVTMFKSFLTDR